VAIHVKPVGNEKPRLVIHNLISKSQLFIIISDFSHDPVGGLLYSHCVVGMWCGPWLHPRPCYKRMKQATNANILTGEKT